jgi:hypothetical protein
MIDCHQICEAGLFVADPTQLRRNICMTECSAREQIKRSIEQSLSAQGDGEDGDNRDDI